MKEGKLDSAVSNRRIWGYT